jgi:hypothetical protein
LTCRAGDRKRLRHRIGAARVTAGSGVAAIGLASTATCLPRHPICPIRTSITGSARFKRCCSRPRARLIVTDGRGGNTSLKRSHSV